MLRNLGAVIAGYVVMALLVFGTFTLAYLAMGADGAFRPGSYDVTPLWIAASILLGLGSAVAGGWVCARLGRNTAAPMALTLLVLVLGVVLAVPTLMAPHADAPAERTTAVGNMEAMQNAKMPGWISLLNPVIGAAGVVAGSRLGRREGKAA